MKLREGVGPGTVVLRAEFGVKADGPIGIREFSRDKHIAPVLLRKLDGLAELSDVAPGQQDDRGTDALAAQFLSGIAGSIRERVEDTQDLRRGTGFGKVTPDAPFESCTAGHGPALTRYPSLLSSGINLLNWAGAYGDCDVAQGSFNAEAEQIAEPADISAGGVDLLDDPVAAQCRTSAAKSTSPPGQPPRPLNRRSGERAMPRTGRRCPAHAHSSALANPHRTRHAHTRTERAPPHSASPP
jgi:hypothetical protein